MIGKIVDFQLMLGRTDFSDQFRKMVIRHKHIGFDLHVMFRD